MGSAQGPVQHLFASVCLRSDLRAGELRRNGVRVRLQDLPFRALTLVLTRPGEVITREESFVRRCGRRTFLWTLSKASVAPCMRLRDALNDSADNPIFIQTIERRGYRWIGPILSQPLDPGGSGSSTGGGTGEHGIYGTL